MFAYRFWVGIWIAGFWVGVAFASFFDFGWSLSGLFLLLAIVLFLFRRTTFSSTFSFLILGIFFIGLSLGSARLFWADKEKGDLLVGTKIILAGRVVSEPDEREDKTRLLVEETQTKNKILVFAERFPVYFYGDRVKLIGKLQLPENFETANHRIFDYKNYLAARDISYQMFFPEIERLSETSWSPVGSLIFLKKYFQKQIEEVIPEPAAALASGLLLGNRAGLGDKLEEIFRVVGLSHLVVLSGYNLSVVALYILAVLFFLPIRLALGASIVGVFLFTLMVGGGASVVRASIMAIVTLLARGYGRLYEASVALIFAGFLMILWNPKVLVFDLGFQLSFLATLGLIYLTPIIEKYLSFVPERCGLREIIASTLGAQIAVYPWLIYKMGNLSVIGLVVNILVLPAVPWAMLLAFLTGLSGLFWRFLSLPFAYGSCFVLEYIIKLAEFFSRFPLASVNIPVFSLWVTMVVYLALIISVFCLNKHFRK